MCLRPDGGGDRIPGRRRSAQQLPLPSRFCWACHRRPRVLPLVPHARLLRQRSRGGAGGTPYMQWRFLGFCFSSSSSPTGGFFNGIGHTKVFMIRRSSSTSRISFSTISSFSGPRHAGHGACRRRGRLGRQQPRRLAVLRRCNFSPGIPKNVQVLLELRGIRKTIMPRS